MDRLRPENEPLLNIKFFNFKNQKRFIFKPRPNHIFQKKELRSRWFVPLKISYTITWLAIVQFSKDMNPDPHQDFFLDPHPHFSDADLQH
jgi:hypothetical protein